MADSNIQVTPISVIILTLNEEVNIRECLASVSWADDVIVVDSGSRDRTLALAAQARAGVRVFTHAFQDFGDQRNWALDNTAPKHEWVLFLDADERCTPACTEAMRAAVAGAGSTVGFYLTCRNIFLGRWIKRCTLYPSWQFRLLKLGQVRYRKEGHGQREVTNGQLGYVREPYDHYPFSKGMAEWTERHDVYSTNEVELIRRLRAEPLALGDLVGSGPVARRRCLKRLAARMGCRPAMRFIYLYLLRGGFLDGRPGFAYCRLRVAHEINITAKLREAERGAKPLG